MWVAPSGHADCSAGVVLVHLSVCVSLYVYHHQITLVVFETKHLEVAFLLEDLKNK